MRRQAPDEPRMTPCHLRIHSDLRDIGSLYNVTTSFPDPQNVQLLHVTITPSRGIWASGRFVFEFTIPDQFPFERPHVKCLTRVWHPNIEETGAVCLNILRDTYTPVMTLSHLIAGLQFLFDEPNPDSPLNNDAARQFKDSYPIFCMKARKYMELYCEQ